MSYINTLILQQVLSRPEWENKLQREDKRALNLLFHSHINPYGLFPLDFEKRLGITVDSIKTGNEDQPDTVLEGIGEKDLAELSVN